MIFVDVLFADTATVYDYSSQSLSVDQVITPATSGNNFVAIYDKRLAILQADGDSGSGKCTILVLLYCFNYDVTILYFHRPSRRLRI